MSGPFSEAAKKARTAVVEEDAPLAQTAKGESEEEKNRREFFEDLKVRFGTSAPDQTKLDEWKSKSGRVRWIELGPDEVYFFRAFRAAEYRGWIQTLQDVAQKDPQKADELLKERVVCRCVLYPQINQEDTGALFAGTIDTLFQQIQIASNFIPLETAMMMVREW